MKEIAIICNPQAGSGKAFKKWKTFQTELDDSNLQYNVFFTEKSKHATALTLSALKKGANRIVSFGGDGTLNEVVQGILLSQTNVINNVDLVVIGAGSSNDFEKTFDKKSWIEKIYGHETNSIDLIKIDLRDLKGNKKKHYCINNSSIGIISEAGDRFNKAKGLTKVIKRASVDAGAILAGIQTIIGFQSISMCLNIDKYNKTIDSLYNITIFKNPYVAGDMYYDQCVERDDGMLSVTTIESNSRFKLFKLIPALYTGNALDKKGVNYFECKSLELDTKSNLIVEADGEIIGKPPVKYSVLSKKLRVVV